MTNEPLNPRAVLYASMRAAGTTIEQAARMTSISVLAAKWLEQDEAVKRLIRHGQWRRMFSFAVSQPPHWDQPARAA